MPGHRVDDGAGLGEVVALVQRQTVLWYQEAAGRAAQLPNPTRGLLTFLDSTGAYE
jgi:hypothetical protein